MSRNDAIPPVRMSERATGMKENAIRNLLALLENPDIMSFAGGIPDPALFPRRQIADIAERVLSATRPDALQYGATAGTMKLREMIAERMSKRGVRCTAENIIVTTGSQQAVDLAARVFNIAGEKVLVEDPTYLGALQTFRSHGQEIAVMDAAMSSKHPVCFAYVVPDHANPTGLTMPEEARRALLQSAYDKNFVILEDAAYQELSYNEEPLLSIQALDCALTGSIEDSRVIYCGSFSKTMAPALRVGWACAPQKVIRTMTRLKECADIVSSPVNQMIMSNILEDFYDGHVAHLVDTYRARMDAMHRALSDYMPERVSWHRPTGGMFFWLTLPEGADSDALLRQSIQQAKVAFVPGHNFRIDQSRKNFMRLSFCLYEPGVITHAVKRLGHCLTESLQAEKNDLSAVSS